jgi:4-phytase/acid phosphatase
VRATSRWLAILAVLVAATLTSPPVHAESSWTVDRVVMLMRHGVRPPLKEPPAPMTVAPDPWPTWDVPTGWLTEHGAAAIRLLGTADAKWLTEEGVLPATGCLMPGAVEVVSDSDQRTIATGDAYLSTLMPNCGIINEHKDQGVRDPLFDEYPDAGVSAGVARRAIDEALGPDGIAGADRQAQPVLALLTRIACGGRNGGCGVNILSDVSVDLSGKHRPKLTGGLGYGAEMAQDFLLEYAEGKPMAQVGWGRAAAADIRDADALHVLTFAVSERPRVLAVANAGKIAQRMLESLLNGPSLAIIVGHDTEIANVGGLLDLHWSIPGFADDDPAPGGALGFEVVHDQTGERFVRTFYRAQPLDEIRSLSLEPPVRVPLAVPGCNGQALCPFETFTALLKSAIGS